MGTAHQLAFDILLLLANTLWTQSGQSSQPQDLDEAIQLYHGSPELCPPSHPKHSMSMINLALALWTRFGQSGQAQDLEDAIQMYRGSLELLPPGHPERSMSMMNLIQNQIGHRIIWAGVSKRLVVRDNSRVRVFEMASKHGLQSTCLFIFFCYDLLNCFSWWCGTFKTSTSRWWRWIARAWARATWFTPRAVQLACTKGRYYQLQRSNTQAGRGTNGTWRSRG